MTSSGSCTKEMQGFWLRQEKREERKRWQYWVFSQPILLKLLDTQWSRFHQPSFTDEDTDDAWKGEWQPTPVFLLGEFYGQRSLVSYSPWGHKESDMTEWLTHTHTHWWWERISKWPTHTHKSMNYKVHHPLSSRSGVGKLQGHILPPAFFCK